MSTATSAAASPTPRAERHRLVDALRGFALLGILLVNVEFIFQHAEVGWRDYTAAPDLVARWLITALGQTKIYPLFALLFGYGLALQLSRAAAAGAALAPRYRRRMAGLIALGVLHGVLFFPGDILVIYGVVGALAFLLRRAEPARLLRIAATTYAAAAGVWLIAGLLDLAYGGGAATPTAESLSALSGGSFPEAVAQHLRDWPWTLALLSLVQGPAAFAFFLVGVVLGRGDLLSHPERHRALARRVLVTAGPVGLLGSAVGATLAVMGGATATLGFAVGFASAPLLAGGYIAGLALLLGSHPGPLARPLEAGGRMSLTIYLLESVVATTLSYGYGAGLFGEIGAAEGIVLSVAVWLALSLGAIAWFRWARFGPAEWALRTLTYARPQPLRI